MFLKAAGIEEPVHERVSVIDGMNSQFYDSGVQQAVLEKASGNFTNLSFSTGSLPTDACSCNYTSRSTMLDRASADKWVSRKSNRETPKREDVGIYGSTESTRMTSSDNASLKEAYTRQKVLTLYSCYFYICFCLYM